MLIDEKTDALAEAISKKEMEMAALQRELLVAKAELDYETKTAEKLFATYHLSAEIAGVLPDLKELTKDDDAEPEKAKVSKYHAMTRDEIAEDEKVRCGESGSVLFSVLANENPEDTAESDF